MCICWYEEMETQNKSVLLLSIETFMKKYSICQNTWAWCWCWLCRSGSGGGIYSILGVLKVEVVLVVAVKIAVMCGCDIGGF